ncbi:MULTISPECIES: hypothetical protein [unclassified Janthinobacterium]|uniref:hypothetical protein n=1 Tax=unclassified Janthinobacterium TaxID=2610881 RepID=UPI00087F7E8F|nr:MULTISPECIES: hypothetical protein [unclassified Janthinobacterium]SDA75490.1 hypothetical protein SAMN03159349_04112 [Janthinobacterium sp. 551a]SFB57357.1 hypothetical protein SAMN03159300_1085 [Janthinobacterium sp. 344]
MKRDAHKQHEEIQRGIKEQEQAMAELLTRVMKHPLDPLYKTLGELKMQLDAVQQANAKAAQAVEAGLIDALEGQGTRMNRRFGEVRDGMDVLKEDLGRHTAGQAERDGIMQEFLLRADGMLAQLDTKADAAGTTIIEMGRDFTRVEDGLGAVRAQQLAVANQLSQELGGVAVRLEQGQAHLDEGLAKTATMLEKIDIKTRATCDNLAAAAQVVAKVDTDLGIIRDQEHAAADQLNRELNGLTQKLDHQRTQLCERIDTLHPGLMPHFESLAAVIDGAAKEVARQHQAMSEAQQALVTAIVQQQLALQLAPFQARTKWLTAVCVLSFASTLALLGMQLFR